MIRRRLRLRRGDGQVYLDRWGFSIILRGGYTEERADTRMAPKLAAYAAAWPHSARRGIEMVWRAGTIHRVRLDECHRIIKLHRTPTWTLCIIGRQVRNWGFYEPSASGGFVASVAHSTARRDVYAEDIGR